MGLSSSWWVLVLISVSASGQQPAFELRRAEGAQIPGIADSNSPALWLDGQLRIYTSNGVPMVSTARDHTFAEVFRTEPSPLRGFQDRPVWIESVFVDQDGIVFAWYHHEQIGICPALSVPVIGAAYSIDGGRSFHDLGLVLSSPDAPDCTARNGYFAGGHGDFTVVADRGERYFYFLFSNYGGPLEEQGVAMARIAFDDRFFPSGAAWKYARGQWTEPGLGGRATPVFAANVRWQDEAADAYWGPSVHWNTHLNRFVVLLNRSCCEPGWPQEGVYISFNSDIADATAWSTPQRVFPEGMVPAGWYPQVLGVEPGETDRLAGKVMRLFLHGTSEWEIVFP